MKDIIAREIAKLKSEVEKFFEKDEVSLDVAEVYFIFTNGMVKPVAASPLPDGALALVQRNCANIDLTCQGIRQRNLEKIFTAFINQPLCSTLTWEQGQALFAEMCENTKEYLQDYTL